MLTTIRNAWKIPELRRKLLFTLVIILLYRIGNVIPVPGVNVQQMSLMFSQQLSNTIFGLFDMMSGSAFSQATIFALSIQPYINASIIIQLLTIAIPALERLSKEGGEEGKKKLTKITRYTTVGLGVLMGFAYYVMLSNYNSQYSNMLLTSTGFLTALVIILTFTAGSTLVMWLGDQISEHRHLYDPVRQHHRAHPVRHHHADLQQPEVQLRRLLVLGAAADRRHACDHCLHRFRFPG